MKKPLGVGFGYICAIGLGIIAIATKDIVDAILCLALMLSSAIIYAGGEK